eukprot:9083766-Lingulodinium_polyedra.AAC.1
MAITVEAAVGQQEQLLKELFQTFEARGTRWVVVLRSWDSTFAQLCFGRLAEQLATWAKHWDA